MPFERKTMRLKFLSMTKMLEAHLFSISPDRSQRDTGWGSDIFTVVFLLPSAYQGCLPI